MTDQYDDILDYESYKNFRILDILQQNEYQSVDFQMITYNVGNSAIPDNHFPQLIIPNKSLYVIVLQEVSTSARTILSSSCPESEIYVGFLQQQLSAYDIKWFQQGSLLMIVASKQLDVSQLSMVATGKAGFKNKGGIAVLIKIQETTLLVIGCHLSASRKPEGLIHRNNDLARICNGEPEKTADSFAFKLSNSIQEAQCLIQMTKDQKGMLRQTPAKIYNKHKAINNASNLMQYCDQCIILGDMNYRVRHKQCDQLIELFDVQKILVFDELSWQLNKNKIKVDETEDEDSSESSSSDLDDADDGQQILNEMEESQITFLPTYKIINGSYDKKRIPSYCDRILKTKVDNDVKVIFNKYNSLHIGTSDHHPVYCEGQMSIRPTKDIDINKIRDEFTILAARLKHQIFIEDKLFHFDEVKYGFQYKAKIRFNNSSSDVIKIKIEKPPIIICQQVIDALPGDNELEITLQILDRKKWRQQFIYFCFGSLRLKVELHINHIDHSLFTELINRIPVGLAAFGRILSKFKQQRSQMFAMNQFDPNDFYQTLLSKQKPNLSHSDVVEHFYIFVKNLNVFSRKNQFDLAAHPVTKLELIAFVEQCLSHHKRDQFLYVIGVGRFIGGENGAQRMSEALCGGAAEAAIAEELE